MGSIRYIQDNRGIRPELKYISLSRYENDWTSVMHSHSTAELLYVYQGSGEIITQERTFPVSRNDFILIPPHLMHTEISDEANPLGYYAVGIGGMSIEPNDSLILELGAGKEAAKRLIASLYREMQKSDTAASLQAEGLLYELISLMIRHKDASITSESMEGMARDMAEVQGFIDYHYAEAIDLDTLSGFSSISRYHLVRKFRKETGYTPMEYLERRRIREACTLLTSTEMSISDIAFSIGFASSSYFAERFRRIMGISPTKYRMREKDSYRTER